MGAAATGMTFPRIAAQYTRASFVKTKTAPLFLTILWPLSNLSGTNLNEGPRKHLSLKRSDFGFRQNSPLMSGWAVSTFAKDGESWTTSR